MQNCNPPRSNVCESGFRCPRRTLGWKPDFGGARRDSMIKAEVLTPSALGEVELAAWSRMMAAMPELRRAFFSATFARACEEAHHRAFVGVLHEGGTICGFLPFQFRTA